MKSLLSSCLFAAAASLALPALAQQQPPPSPAWQAPQFLPQRNNTDIMFRNSTSWTRGEYETFLHAARGNNIPPQPLQRVDLANRVSTLIELGRCTDAREEALAADDRMMALRARQLCRTDREG